MKNSHYHSKMHSMTPTHVPLCMLKNRGGKNRKNFTLCLRPFQDSLTSAWQNQHAHEHSSRESFSRDCDTILRFKGTPDALH